MSNDRSQSYDCRLCSSRKRKHKMRECKGFCRNEWCQVHEPCPKQYRSRTCELKGTVKLDATDDNHNSNNLVFNRHGMSILAKFDY